MDTFPEFKVYAEQIAELARWAYGKGWAPATSTNFSLGLPPHASPALCAITRSGVDKEWIDADQILAITEQGHPVGNTTLLPSAEALLHTMIYLATNAGAVLHTHSVAGAVLSRLLVQQEKLILSGWEILKGLGDTQAHDTVLTLPIFPNSQDIPTLAESIRPCLVSANPPYGFLIAGHGLYTWGKDLSEGKRHLEVLEFLLQCELEVRRHGHVTDSRPTSDPAP